MDQKDNIRKELEELGSTLAGMDKKNPFSVPDYYFQGLPDKMLERVKNEPQPWTERAESTLNRIFARIFQPRYAVTFATCLVLLAVSIGFLKDRETITAPPHFSDISTEAIDSYILLADIDEYELFSTNGAALEGGAENIIPAGITDEELNDYLNNNIDNQTLEEELL